MLLFYITYVVPLCILIPLLTGLIRYKSLNTALRIIFWFLVCSGIGSATDIIFCIRGISTNLLFNVSTVFEFAFISFFYRAVFKKWDKAILLVIGVFTALCVIDFFFIQPGNILNSYTNTLETFLIVGYALIYLNQQSTIDHEYQWANNSLNWMNIAILIYYSSGVCMFVFANYLAKASVDINLVVWSLFDTILLIQYLLFATGFYKCKT